MAVEARHPNLFPLQLLGNREIMNSIEVNTNVYSNNNNTQMGYGLPLSGTTTTETLLPMYSSVMTDSILHPKTHIKSESGLTFNNIPLSRKRSRDSSTYPLGLSYNSTQQQSSHNNNNMASSFSFLGHDLSLHIQQQQLDVDHLISQHMEKVKMEIEEKRKRQTRRMIEVIEERVMKRLKAKEEEIEKIGKLNWALEEKVKSLCIENQIWRDLAQTTEATANALRTNLEQVLAAAAAQVKDEKTRGAGLDEHAAATAQMDDAQSCCGSSGEEEVEKRRLANGAQGKDIRLTSRLCRNCGKEEASVLVLPCRHLCLCGVCGSSLHACPICFVTKNGSLHVNMSSN